MSKWIAVVTAADGTLSAAGPFPSRVQAEGWAADLELATSGGLGGSAVELESPAGYMEAAIQ